MHTFHHSGYRLIWKGGIGKSRGEGRRMVRGKGEKKHGIGKIFKTISLKKASEKHISKAIAAIQSLLSSNHPKKHFHNLPFMAILYNELHLALEFRTVSGKLVHLPCYAYQQQPLWTWDLQPFR